MNFQIQPASQIETERERRVTEAEIRTAQRGQVMLFNQSYLAPELIGLDGQEVSVRYDCHDPSFVLIYTPDGQYVCETKLDANHIDYAPKPITEMVRERRVAATVQRLEAKINQALSIISSAPPAQPLVKQEIAALRRIANYDGYSVTEFGPGMWQFENFFTITLDDGKLNGEIDFYGQHQPNDPDWDVDAWSAEKLRLCFKPCRQNFRACHSMIRSLLGGRTLTFTDGSQLSRQNHLDEVREHGIRYGVDISFEEYSGPVTSSMKGCTV